MLPMDKLVRAILYPAPGLAETAWWEGFITMNPPASLADRLAQAKTIDMSAAVASRLLTGLAAIPGWETGYVTAGVHPMNMGIAVNAQRGLSERAAAMFAQGTLSGQSVESLLGAPEWTPSERKHLQTAYLEAIRELSDVACGRPSAGPTAIAAGVHLQASHAAGEA